MHDGSLKLSGGGFVHRLHQFNSSLADPHVGVFSCFRPNRETCGRHRCCHVCPCIGLRRVDAGGAHHAGSIRVRLSDVGERSAVAQIAQLVEEAHSLTAPAQDLADRIASRFVSAVVSVAAVSFAV